MNAFCKVRRAGALRRAALSACSVLESDKIDYKSASKGVVARSPARPDPAVARLALRGARRRRHRQQPTRSARPPPGLPTAATDAGRRAHRARGRRSAGWWSTARPTSCGARCATSGRRAASCWRMDQPNLGIMETDWAENRAKIPQDFIRNTLGKLLDSVYSTGERDRFRTRLERTRHRRHRDLHQPPRHDRGLQQHRRRTRPSGSPAPPTPSWKPNSCAA